MNLEATLEAIRENEEMCEGLIALNVGSCLQGALLYGEPLCPPCSLRVLMLRSLVCSVPLVVTIS